MSKQITKDGQFLFSEITQMIEEARGTVNKTINAELTILNWSIGKSIQQKIKGRNQANYGKEIIKNLSKELTNCIWQRLEHSTTVALYSIL